MWTSERVRDTFTFLHPTTSGPHLQRFNVQMFLSLTHTHIVLWLLWFCSYWCERKDARWDPAKTSAEVTLVKDQSQHLNKNTETFKGGTNRLRTPLVCWCLLLYIFMLSDIALWFIIRLCTAEPCRLLDKRRKAVGKGRADFAWAFAGVCNRNERLFNVEKYFYYRIFFLSEL